MTASKGSNVRSHAPGLPWKKSSATSQTAKSKIHRSTVRSQENRSGLVQAEMDYSRYSAFVLPTETRTMKVIKRNKSVASSKLPPPPFCRLKILQKFPGKEKCIWKKVCTWHVLVAGNTQGSIRLDGSHGQRVKRQITNVYRHLHFSILFAYFTGTWNIFQQKDQNSSILALSMFSRTVIYFSIKWLVHFLLNFDCSPIIGR